MEPIKYYEQLIAKASEEKALLKKKSFTFSVLRLIFFLAIATVCFTLFNQTTLFFSCFISLSIVFGWIIKKHQSIVQDIQFKENIIRIAGNEIKRIQFDLSEFETGENYNQGVHDFSHDLDLFGQHSLFQLLNRCSFEDSKKQIAKHLRTVPQVDEIKNRQQAIATLEKDPDQLIQWQQHASQINWSSEDVAQIKDWNIDQISIMKPWLFYGSTALFLIELALVFLGYISSTIPLYHFLFNLIIGGNYFKKNSLVHAVLSKKHKDLRHLKHLIDLIQKAPKGAHLDEIKAQFEGQETAGDALNQISNIMGRFDARLNLVVISVLGGICMWDNMMAYQTVQWHQKHAKDLSKWIDAIIAFDELNSLAIYNYNHPHFHLPEVSTSFELKGKDIRHPLLKKEVAIGNDFHFDHADNIYLITGSNMAGKSTFLRAIGTNIVLAHLGVKVAAQSLTVSPMNLYTSMRITDSVSSGASTFFAEVNRISQLIEKSKTQKVFFLLDEILKGTNSIDKLKGSQALLAQLLKYHACGFIATHDLELSKMANDHEHIINKRFEVEISNGEFHFDYQIKDGICQVMNATELMRKMGIEIQ